MSDITGSKAPDWLVAGMTRAVEKSFSQLMEEDWHEDRINPTQHNTTQPNLK